MGTHVHVHVSLPHGYYYFMCLYHCSTDTLVYWTLLYHIDTCYSGYLLHWILLSLLHGFTCIHTLNVPVSLLHGTMLLLPELLLFEYSCLLFGLLLIEYSYTPITLYTYLCNRITDKNPVNLLHVLNIANKLAYLYSGILIISTATPTSGGTCVELSVIWSKVPHHTYMWWRPPLESMEATSRILTPPGNGWRGYLWCSCYRYCYWSDSIFLLSCILVIRTVMLASGIWCVRLSVTRNKVPHHIHGGGHLLNLWGPPLESHIAGCWDDRGILSALVIHTQYMIHSMTQQW